MPDQSGGTLNWTELAPTEIGRRFVPRFPKLFEQKFLRDRAKDRDHNPIGLVLVCILLFDLGSISDNMIVHGILARSLLVHFTFYTPICLACVFVLRYSTRYIHQEIAKFVVTICSTVTSFIIFCPVQDVPAVVLASRSIIMVTFGALILRQSLKSTFLANLAIAIGQTIFLHTCPSVTSSKIPICTSMTIAGMVVSLLGSLKVERTDRLAYLLLRQSESNATQLRRANRELAAIAQSDGLTGLSNRRHFDSVSQTLWRDRDVESFPVSIIMADIDHFKHLNDTHGHLAGDEVLIQVAQLLRASIRSGHDVVARFGGEEFVLLLPGMEAQKALEIAERVTAAVRQSRLEVPSAPHPLRVTISCGVATALFPDNADITELIAAADHALYQSKHAGRDQVTFHNAQLQPA